MNSERRFTLLDLMIVVAATAPGMLLFREYQRISPALSYLISSEHAPSKLRAWDLIRGFVPGLAVLSLGLLLPRFLAPRPRRRRAFLAPGTIPGLVTALACGVVLAQVALDWPMMSRTHFPNAGMLGLLGVMTLRMIGMKDLVGQGVASAWAMLWLGGGWRSEASWIDRAGRVVGVAWISLGLASWLIGQAP